MKIKVITTGKSAPEAEKVIQEMLDTMGERDELKLELERKTKIVKIAVIVSIHNFSGFMR